jgi:hypothetical protein
MLIQSIDICLKIRLLQRVLPSKQRQKAFKIDRFAPFFAAFCPKTGPF